MRKCAEMATAVQVPASATVGFFERRTPASLILASFPLVTVPLATALIVFTDRRFLLMYIWLFGLTHFVLTLSVYLQSENLRHFTATNRNIVMYFVVPLAIMLGFYVTGVLALRDKFPAVAVVVAALIRLLDFNHLNRQSFGVLQLFKARAGARVPQSAKRAENAFFACLTGLLLTTYLAGGVSPLLPSGGVPALGTAIATSSPALLPVAVLRPAALILGLAALGLAVYSVRALLRAWKENGRGKGIRQVFEYYAFQTIGALMAVVSSPLYFASLAMHYVEYHVLMFPRCFHSSLDERSSLDAWFAGLRRHRSVFYAVLIGGAGIVMMLILMQNNPTSAFRANPMRYRAIVSIFDGLFVFHYFVEMLIWRFSDPFFRRTLTPLYFTPRPRTA